MPASLLLSVSLVVGVILFTGLTVRLWLLDKQEEQTKIVHDERDVEEAMTVAWKVAALQSEGDYDGAYQLYKDVDRRLMLFAFGGLATLLLRSISEWSGVPPQQIVQEQNKRRMAPYN